MQLRHRVVIAKVLRPDGKLLFSPSTNMTVIVSRQLQEKYPCFPYNIREAAGLIRREMSRLQRDKDLI